jgi:hypothetical protein
VSFFADCRMPDSNGYNKIMTLWNMYEITVLATSAASEGMTGHAYYA